MLALLYSKSTWTLELSWLLWYPYDYLTTKERKKIQRMTIQLTGSSCCVSLRCLRCFGHMCWFSGMILIRHSRCCKGIKQMQRVRYSSCLGNWDMRRRMKKRKETKVTEVYREHKNWLNNNNNNITNINNNKEKQITKNKKNIKKILHKVNRDAKMISLYGINPHNRSSILSFLPAVNQKAARITIDQQTNPPKTCSSLCF